MKSGRRLIFGAAALLLFSMTVMISRYNLRATEYDIDGSGYREPPAKLSLACHAGVVDIWFQWETTIGKKGGYRRHLFDSGDDVDVLLPTLRGGTATGYIHRDKEAKALIAYLMPLGNGGRFSAQVFPQGADPNNGAWVWRHFSVADFRKAATAVAKECHWNLLPPHPSPLRVIPAGGPYLGE